MSNRVATQNANAAPLAGGVAFRRLRRLPARALTACVALLAAAAVPAAVTISGAVAEPPPGVGSALFAVANVAATCVALGVVLAFEPPRSASPLAYARQLRARLLELQSTFDADDPRRSGEGKEKEDDRLPPDP